MTAKDKKIVVSITTFNRIDCARINIEIIKKNYKAHWPIVHACSSSLYKKYKEDVLIKCNPLPMPMGPFDLLKQSIIRAQDIYQADFIVHIEGDTWLMDQTIIEKYINQLDKDKYGIIAASKWNFDKQGKWKISKKIYKNFFYFATKITKKMGLRLHLGWENTFSTQFFILKNSEKIQHIFKTMKPPKPGVYLEKYLYNDIKKRFGKRAFLMMDERDPVHPLYRESCDGLKLYSSHQPKEKKKTLKRFPFLSQGFYMKKLLRTKNLNYYNKDAPH